MDSMISYYGYFEEYSSKRIAQKCVKLFIADHFQNLCSGSFTLPSFEEMAQWVAEEMSSHFEEKVIPLIEKCCPGISEEDLDTQVKEIEMTFIKKHDALLTATTHAALQELNLRTKAMEKELKNLKRKYTG